MKILIILLGLILFLGFAFSTDITDCQSIDSSGTYVLQNDLNYLASDCLIINSNDVVLDGNFHKIFNLDNLTATNGWAINGTNADDNVFIKNFRIDGGNGFNLSFITNLVVEDNNIVVYAPTIAGLQLGTLSGSVIQNNIITGSTNFGGAYSCSSVQLIGNTFIADGSVVPFWWYDGFSVNDSMTNTKFISPNGSVTISGTFTFPDSTLDNAEYDLKEGTFQIRQNDFLVDLVALPFLTGVETTVVLNNPQTSHVFVPVYTASDVSPIVFDATGGALAGIAGLAGVFVAIVILLIVITLVYDVVTGSFGFVEVIKRFF